jgi:tetrahydromethanopterin S-methyltransferase subunit F
LYAHDSQSGVMTNNNAGIVKIEYSIFERLGGKAQGAGYAHALYIKADELFFYKSKIISTKGEGSGIKSRSKKVVIDSSLLASMDAIDSRLVDMANYGELIIKNSVLQQGSHSSNSQLLAYGLETNITSEFDVNRVELVNNIILFDNKKSNVLISYRLLDEMVNRNNVFIGYFNLYLQFIKNNMWYTSRKRAHILPYPYFPQIDEIKSLRLLINTNGVSENGSGSYKNLF